MVPPFECKNFSNWIYHNSEIHMIDLDSQCTVYICHVSLARVSLGGREGTHAELAKSEITQENASKGHPSSNLSRRTRPILLATKARFLLLMASSLTPFGKLWVVGRPLSGWLPLRGPFPFKSSSIVNMKESNKLDGFLCLDQRNSRYKRS